MTTAALEEGRFELRGELGSGGMGYVHRVFDHQRGEEVALKSLRAQSARDIYRFKREFRALADLTHPNLVMLHELFSVGEQWMFTMELVDGVPFHRWARPGGAGAAADVTRLRRALVQLADGLAAIHAAGKLHRDLKPNNLLVEKDGRVVILDFGLVADASQPVDRTHLETAVGTPAYMSPEQAADLPLGPASDMYSLGAILYELLTGRRPFEGLAAMVLHDKQHTDPPPVAERSPDAPKDLAVLTTMLLARDPAARPSALEVLALLGEKPSPWTQRLAARAVRAAPGERDAELAVLREAFEASHDHAVIALLEGPRGAGKTVVLETFLAEVADDDAVILRGRASSRESLPTRAMDWVVDSAAAYLLGLPPAERAAMMPADVAAISRLFPAFRRVPGAELLLPGVVTSLPSDDLRDRAFGAMMELCRAIAAKHPLLIVVEDGQHGRLENIQLTSKFLARPDAPPLLALFAVRGDEAEEMLQAIQAFPGDLRTIHLAPRPPVRPDLGKPGGS
jgi:eukaryotic-like serine/threonine-protein kinase